MASELSVPRFQVNKDHQAQHLLLPLRYQRRFETNTSAPSSKYTYPNVEATNVVEAEKCEEECAPVKFLSYSPSSSTSTSASGDKWPGNGPIDLSKVELTFAQKLWLANQHLIHKVTVRELHEKYNIRIARLWHYINGVKNGTYFKEKRGRPYLLDKKSVTSILESIFIRPTMSEQDLKNIVLLKHKEMYIQRTEANSDSEKHYKKITMGTVNRYIQDIRGWLPEYAEKRKLLESYEEDKILNDEAWNGCKVM